MKKVNQMNLKENNYISPTIESNSENINESTIKDLNIIMEDNANQIFYG